MIQLRQLSPISGHPYNISEKIKAIFCYCATKLLIKIQLENLLKKILSLIFNIRYK